MLDQELQQHFLQLPPSQQDLITSDFAEEAAELFGYSLKLSEEEIDVFENGIVLVLLFIFNGQDLKEYLSAHTKASHVDIDSAVNALMKTVPLPPQSAPVAIIPSNTVPVASPLINHPLSHSLDNEILETEHSFQHTPGLRTMAGDMKTAATPGEPPVYQSSQAELLSKPPTAAQPGSQTPRWDSEA